MSGRWLINGALLLACGLLVLLARWQPAPPPGLADLVGLTPAAVTRIRLHHGHRPPLELASSPDGWMLRAPRHEPVSPAMSERLDALLRAPAVRAFNLVDLAGRDLTSHDLPRAASSAAPSSSSPTNPTPESEALEPMLEALGLADPWLVLEFNDVRLQAGSAEPIEHRRYLQAGDDILLIDDRWLLPLLAPPEDYLSVPAPEPPGEVNTLIPAGSD